MIVNVNGIRHEVATLAEARALAGVTAATAPLAKREFASEANGVCNRCIGRGTYSTTRVNGQCFRCEGTGRAPGYDELSVMRNNRGVVIGLAKLGEVHPAECACSACDQADYVDEEHAAEWGAGKVATLELMAAEPAVAAYTPEAKPKRTRKPKAVAIATEPKAKRTRKAKLVSYERS